jgi:hypothetical protein
LRIGILQFQPHAHGGEAGLQEKQIAPEESPAFPGRISGASRRMGMHVRNAALKNQMA